MRLRSEHSLVLSHTDQLVQMIEYQMSQNNELMIQENGASALLKLLSRQDLESGIVNRIDRATM